MFVVYSAAVVHANRTRTYGYSNAAEESRRKKLLLSIQQIVNVSSGLARLRSRGLFTRGYIERAKPKNGDSLGKPRNIKILS